MRHPCVVFTVAWEGLPGTPQAQPWVTQGDLVFNRSWEDNLQGAADLAALYRGHAVVTVTEADYPDRQRGGQPVFCDDCERYIPEEEDFWVGHHTCPSEIFCDDCGSKHGYPHQEPIEDGWEPTDAFSQYEDPDRHETPQQANERDARLEWESDQEANARWETGMQRLLAGWTHADTSVPQEEDDCPF